MDGWFRRGEREREMEFPSTAARDGHCFNSRLSALIPFYEIAFFAVIPSGLIHSGSERNFDSSRVWQFDRLRRRRHCAFVNGECGFAMDPFNGPINHRNISTHFQNNRPGGSWRRKKSGLVPQTQRAVPTPGMRCRI